MAEKHEGKGGKILHMTVKRARRVQEKMMQKLGKSDQTRDEVFEEFVTNFHKQNACAVKLQKEMMKYMNNIRVLYQNTKSMSETLRELYEEEWDGCEKQRDLMEQRILLWEDLLTSLSSKTVEPMTNYIARFADVKNRIQKRERKVVDYDLRRRELETARAKAKVSDQKIQQVEETHMQAKQLYDEITDELYEELPTFYDSRIQFYAQIFQSIAASEAKFHAEVARLDEDLARVMDGLASEAATGIHSTKKQRSALAATPKLLSRPGEEDSEDDSEEAEGTSSHSPSLTHLSPTPTPTAALTIENGPDELVSSPSSRSPDGADDLPPSIPPKPEATQPHEEEGEREGEGEGDTGREPVASPQETEEEEVKRRDSDTATQSPEVGSVSPLDQDRERDVVSPLKTPPPKPAPLDIPEPGTQPSAETESDEKKVLPPPDNLLFRAVATHMYQGEDEDELTFEKGAIIYVVPYEDPDDEEDGWCMGILPTNGDKGIFPQNFTKRQD